MKSLWDERLLGLKQELASVKNQALTVTEAGAAERIETLPPPPMLWTSDEPISFSYGLQPPQITFAWDRQVEADRHPEGLDRGPGRVCVPPAEGRAGRDPQGGRAGQGEPVCSIGGPGGRPKGSGHAQGHSQIGHGSVLAKPAQTVPDPTTPRCPEGSRALHRLSS